MSLHSYPNRLLWIAGLSSALLLGCCGGLAYYLDSQQADTAAFLSENIRSRKAADNLEEALAGLVLYHERGQGDVAPLQERVRQHLADIESLSDKPREQELTAQLKQRIGTYLRQNADERKSGTGRNAAYLVLRDACIPLCQELQNFNEDQIERSERAHRASVRRMSWGLLIIGGMGSIAGLVLGYGVARRLRQTIHQFLVRVQGASEMLGQEMSTIEWRREGEAGTAFEGEGDLMQQVERVVGRLQERDREMRRSERLAAVGQLAAGVAHEIRNPLTSAILLIETGRRDPAAGGLTDEDLDLIEGELHRIESSLKTFLDFARPPKLETRACDLVGVVRESLQLTRGRIEQQGIEVRFLPAEPNHVLNGDFQQLRQVAVNLILNALDMMPFGGRLEITTRAEPGAVTLFVSDTGPGIRADIGPRLFQPFATAKETGIGLGLVISKRAVEEHGGTIAGYNRPGGGACFEVRLPSNGDNEEPRTE